MRTLVGLFVIVPLMAFIGGCGSDSPSGGGGDTTPPGISSVTAIDASHVQVTFNESVKKQTAEHRENYAIVEVVTPLTTGAVVAAPGDTTHVASAVLGSDGVTVTITTQDAMQNLSYEMSVSGVEDLYGNAITTKATSTFTGSNAGDTTPPGIVQRSPAPGATNVGIATSVTIQFSEAMNSGSVQNAFMWSYLSGFVAWNMNEESGNTFVFTPQQPLLNNTTYNITLANSAQDLAGNTLSATANWTFTTTASADNIPPTLVSSTPTNNAVNVPVTTNLSLTFSEPVEQTSLQGVILVPDVGTGVETWSNGGRTVTFNPDVDLTDNTQYTLTILPGGVYDLAGNGNTTLYQITWSTGPSLATGRINGVVTGDPGTPAANPAGALVIAADSNPFAGTGDDFGIGGSGVVAAGGAYSIMHLADGWYFPLAAMDSNGDGTIDPDFGDAIGAYGVVIPFDFEPDSVQIFGGNTLNGINFALYDATSISGALSYSGIVTAANFFVGAFDTTGFDINNLPSPDFGTQGFWPQTTYSINELDTGLLPGTYYVGAYIDANFNSTYDPASDPAGFYGGVSPIPITLGSGDDALNTDITLVDPAALRAGPSVSWTPKSAADPKVRDAVAWMRRVLAEHK